MTGLVMSTWPGVFEFETSSALMAPYAINVTALPDGVRPQLVRTLTKFP